MTRRRQGLRPGRAPGAPGEDTVRQDDLAGRLLRLQGTAGNVATGAVISRSPLSRDGAETEQADGGAPEALDTGSTGFVANVAGIGPLPIDSVRFASREPPGTGGISRDRTAERTVTVTRQVDKASPELAARVMNGRVIDTVTIVASRDGAVLWTLVLHSVLISAYTESGGRESVTFNASSAEMQTPAESAPPPG